MCPDLHVLAPHGIGGRTALGFHPRDGRPVACWVVHPTAPGVVPRLERYAAALGLSGTGDAALREVDGYRASLTAAGGWATLALSSRNPRGVAGMINFAGGRGGRQQRGRPRGDADDLAPGQGRVQVGGETRPERGRHLALVARDVDAGTGQALLDKIADEIGGHGGSC